MRHALVLALVLAAPALASAKKPLRVTPWVLDDGRGGVFSDWVRFSGPGNSDPALLLEKERQTSDFVAAGAAVEGVDGITLTELGFDVWNDGHCGAGAPRFNVFVTMPDDGSTKLFFFGCSYGTHTPAPDKPATFTRVRFDDSDAFAQDGVSYWPGFGNAVVESIDIVFDEGIDQGSGVTAIDNIDVNGELVGRGHGR